MKALVLKAERHASNYGKHFYYLFLKGEDGHSYRTCLRPGFENWDRWSDIVADASGGQEMWLDSLHVLKPGLVDADSWPRRIPAPELAA